MTNNDEANDISTLSQKLSDTGYRIEFNPMDPFDKTIEMRVYDTVTGRIIEYRRRVDDKELIDADAAIKVFRSIIEDLDKMRRQTFNNELERI